MNIRANSPYYWKGMLSIVFAFITTGLLIADSEEHSMDHSQMAGSETTYNFDDSVLDGESVSVSDGDTVVVKSTGTDFSYETTEIRAKAGSTITIRYENTSNMPHNIVLVKTRADINPVGTAALQARDNDYIPQDEGSAERMIAFTNLAKPGYTEEITITVPPPGTYPYICTYPGHFTMMQGQLISQE